MANNIISKIVVKYYDVGSVVFDMDLYKKFYLPADGISFEKFPWRNRDREIFNEGNISNRNCKIDKNKLLFLMRFLKCWIMESTLLKSRLLLV